MNRITKKFNDLRKNSEKAVITFLMAGHPNMQKTHEIILSEESMGVDIIEIGIPFSDPLADGEIIQNAANYSLKNGTKVEDIFLMVENLRKKTEIPLLFLVYYNIVFNYGNEKFAKKCKEIGIDGLIIPDLPYEEEFELTKYLDDSIHLIPLVSPTSEKRIEKIVKNKKGFIYFVSSLGTTGQNNAFHEDVIEKINKVKEYSNLPISIGFGIKNREDYDFFIDYVDGIIIGSKIVETIEKTGGNIEKISEVIRMFKQ